MSQSSTPNQLASLTVRSFDSGDQQAVSRLYDEGLLTGQIAPNDTGADIDNLAEAYFTHEHDHFWVAEHNGQVVGMIGGAGEGQNTAEVRRRRVEKDYKDTQIAEKLLETALAHCKHHGYLKIRLDTRFDPDAVVDLFDRFGFQHTRTKSIQVKDLLEFYLDLYLQPTKQPEQ